MSHCINPRARRAGWGVAFCECAECVVDRMIRQSKPADEIAAKVGWNEHFVLARMEDAQ